VRRLLVVLCLLVVIAATAAGGVFGVRLAADRARSGDAPAPAPAPTATATPRVADLGEHGLALLPPGFRLHGRQNTLERTCFVGDGEHLEPCVELTVDGRGVVGDRRYAFERRAHELGWRRAGFSHAPNGPTLELVRGSIRARIVFGPAGVTPGALASNSLRLWDPTRRRAIADPVEARPAGDAAARAPFATAANAACDRLRSRLERLRMGDAPSKEALAAFSREWRRFVAEVAALEPPAEDTGAVAALLRELRRFGASVDLLRRARGEDALPASVGLLHQGQRVESAFAQFGLARCSAPGRAR
jgi:hypothetical protein